MGRLDAAQLGRAPAGVWGMGTPVPVAGGLGTRILTAPAAVGVLGMGRTCAGCSQSCKRLL